MSKKKRKDKAQPTTAAPPPQPKADGGIVIPRAFTQEFTISFADMTRMFTTSVRTEPDKAKLTDAVAAQVEALTADFDGTGGEELPSPPKDLTTYRDAWASAAAKCDHQDAIEIMYGREWLCESCHRMLNREDMRKAGWSRWG